jgi:GNAT superfamily N-acetyltransferase
MANQDDQHMLIERLQHYLREKARRNHETIRVPPFTLFLSRNDAAADASVTIPDIAPQGAVGAALETLCSVCAARERQPRITFIEEFAPSLAQSLRAAGFTQQERLPLLICTPAIRHAAPDIAGLTFAMLIDSSPASAIRAGLDINERGFNPQTTMVFSDEDVEQFRKELIHGRAFTAYLDGQPVSGGMFLAPLDGLTELVGITTLEPFRGRGLAGALTAHITRVAFDHDVEAVFLIGASDTASRVYERVGFRRIATVATYVRVVG